MRPAGIVLLVITSLCVHVASAAPVRPKAHMLMPVESGSLHRYAELQFHYSSLSEGPADFDYFYLAIDGEWSFADRFAIGAMLPFLQQAGLAYGSRSTDETRFGNLQINLKAKLLGSSSGLSVAAYFNTTLPTHSGEGSRDLVVLQPGLAASFDAKLFSVGGNTGVWGIAGDNSGFLWEWSAYAGTSIVPMFELMAAIQWSKSITDDIGVAAAFSPLVRFNPLLGLFIDVGARVPLNDEAKLFYALGEAAFLAGVGWAMR